MTNTANATLEALSVFSSNDGPIIEDKVGLMAIPTSEFFRNPNAIVERVTKLLLGHLVSLVQLRSPDTGKPYREILTGKLVDERGREFTSMEFKIDKNGRYELDLSKGHDQALGLGTSVIHWCVAERIEMDRMSYVLVSSAGEIRELSEGFEFDRGDIVFVKGATNEGKIVSRLDSSDVVWLERYGMDAKEAQGDKPALPKTFGIRVFHKKRGRKMLEAFGDRKEFHRDNIHIRWTNIDDHATWRVYGKDDRRRSKKISTGKISTGQAVEALKNGLGS